MTSRFVRKPAPVLPLRGGEPASDGVLVQRALLHDRQAEEAIYLRYVGHVNALCTRLLRAPADVEDVVQDTFVDAFTQLSSLREPERLRHWITGIAVHKVHRRFRRRQLTRLLGLDRSTDETSHALIASSSVSPELRTELACLDRALAAVPEMACAAWLLRYVDGYGLHEVATLCSCSLATAKRRIAQAQQVLRAYVRFEEANDD